MKPDSTRSLNSRWLLTLSVLTAATGLCLSFYFRSRIAQTEATAARLTAETLRLNTEQELTLFVDVLESVRALHALSDAVDQAAMDEFIEKGLVHQHAVLGAFGLAQRITPHVRSLLEKEAEEQGTGYRVVQKDSTGVWVPAHVKSAYYPLTWRSRSEGLNIPIGFDFSSMDEALQTIRQIEQTHRTTLTPSPIPWDSEDGRLKTENRSEIPASPFQTPSRPHATTPTPLSPPSPSYWVFAPITPRQLPNTVIGFAVAVFNPDAILKRVAARSALSPELRLSLINPANSNRGESIRLVNKKWRCDHPLEAMGTQWMFECSLPVNVTGHRSATALAFGLIITALMTSQLLILGGRTRTIEAEVRSRTEDLRIANVHLKENLYERARMEEEMNELAAHERRRIGRDLHDSLGQKLAGAVFISRSLLNYLSNSEDQELGDRGQEAEGRDQGSGGRGQEAEHFTSNIQHSTPHTPPEYARTLNKTLKDAVAQVRNMARGLAPVALNDESLIDALQQLAEEMTALYGVSCTFPTTTATLRSGITLDQKTKEQLYLIAREAVNNAARHAKAKQVSIQMNNDESEWTLRIEDNGKGLPCQPQPPSPTRQVSKGHSEQPNLKEGMGLRIMRHRAHLIGAEFSILSLPDQGTCVTVKGRIS